MRRLRIGILDLIATRPTHSPYARLMHPNFHSIMPQAVGVWAEELGHEVHYLSFTGSENLRRTLPSDIDLLFVGAFTPSAYLAYAISSLYRSQGVVTVLGGPHARAYAEDARLHFDYVLGLVDKPLIRELLQGFSRHPTLGVRLGARRQPETVPSLRQRWRFTRHNLDKAPLNGVVMMVGSLGCPYRCGFCVDARIDYQTLGFEELRDDLAFLVRERRNPLVGWHDPNFGVRFDAYMEAMEAAAPPGSIRHVAEMSLSLLSPAHLEALGRHNFIALVIGIESWFDFNDKTKQGRARGEDKVAEVAERVNLAVQHVPYIQTNFVWGLDADAGPLPFELNRRFVDLAPAAFPSHSVFTAYGDSAPLGVELARQDRVLNVPFRYQDTATIHNVALANYSGQAFYEGLVRVIRHSYGKRSTLRRFQANPHGFGSFARWMVAVRSAVSESRAAHYARLARGFACDPEFRAFEARDTEIPPACLRTPIRAELGDFYFHLPSEIQRFLERGQLGVAV